LRSLPRLCNDYPSGDAALSLNVPDSHLQPHCSVDSLRIRCHLGIEIPENCRIRVGSETRDWEQGKAIMFDDSFEHEVWNRGTTDRIVMIVDFWHPELTEIETRALAAGFRKAEVRNLFYAARVYTADNPEAHLRYLEREIAKQDSDPLIREYWD
jgi:aspartyl/asparaginyl beta-hydroxylase (cupin superfamily)